MSVAQDTLIQFDKLMASDHWMKKTIFIIGIVGLMLEYALIKIATAFTYEEVKS